MSKKRKNDRLEEFFKAHLEHFEEDPGLELFDAIAETIPPKPSRWNAKSLRGLLIPLSLSLLIGALSFSLFQYQNVRGLSKQVEVQNQEINGLKKQLEAIEQYNFLDTLNSQSNPSTSDKHNPPQAFYSPRPTTPTSNVPVVNASNIQNNGRPVISGTQAVGSGQLFDNLQESNLYDYKEQATAEGVQPGQGNALGNNLQLSAAPLRNIPGKLFAAVPSSSFQLAVKDWNKMQQRRRPWSIMPYVEYVQTYIGTSAIPTHMIDQPNSRDTNYGILLGFNLNDKWSIQTGIGYKTSTLRFNYPATNLNYVATTPDENGIATHTYPLSNTGIEGFDFLGYEVSLANSLQDDGNDLLNSEAFMLNVDKGTYINDYLSIPFWVNYNLTKHKRIQFTARAGLLWHTLLNSRTGPFAVRVIGDRASFDRLRYVGSVFNVSSQKANFLDLGLGLGASYAINPNWRFGLQPIGYYSVTPQFNKTTWSVGLNTNLNYRF